MLRAIGVVCFSSHPPSCSCCMAFGSDFIDVPRSIFPGEYSLAAVFDVTFSPFRRTHSSHGTGAVIDSDPANAREVEMFESDDIVDYLYDRRAAGSRGAFPHPLGHTDNLIIIIIINIVIIIISSIIIIIIISRAPGGKHVHVRTCACARPTSPLARPRDGDGGLHLQFVLVVIWKM